MLILCGVAASIAIRGSVCLTSNQVAYFSEFVSTRVLGEIAEVKLGRIIIIWDSGAFVVRFLDNSLTEYKKKSIKDTSKTDLLPTFITDKTTKLPDINVSIHPFYAFQENTPLMGVKVLTSRDEGRVLLQSIISNHNKRSIETSITDLHRIIHLINKLNITIYILMGNDGATLGIRSLYITEAQSSTGSAFSLKASIVAEHEVAQCELLIPQKLHNNGLVIEGSITNMGLTILQKLQVPLLNTVIFSSDLKFQLHVRFPFVLEKISFSAVAHNGTIQGDYWSHKMKLTFLSIRGGILNPLDNAIWNIENVDLVIDDKLSMQGSIRKQGTKLSLIAALKTKDLAVADAYRYWPVTSAGGANSTKLWLNQRLKGGTIVSADIKVVFDTSSRRFLDIISHVAVKEGRLKLQEDMPPIEVDMAELKIMRDSIDIHIEAAKYDTLILKNFDVSVPSFSVATPELKISGHIIGEVRDSLALANTYYSASKLEHLPDIESLKGQADSMLTLCILLGTHDNAASHTVRFSNIGIRSTVKNFMIGIYGKNFYSKNLSISLDPSLLVRIKGVIRTDRKSSSLIVFEKKLANSQGTKDKSHVVLCADFRWLIDALGFDQNAEKLGSFIGSTYGKVCLNIDMYGPESLREYKIRADLKDLDINIKTWNFKKKLGVPGYITTTISSSKVSGYTQLNILKYEQWWGDFSLSASGKVILKGASKELNITCDSRSLNDRFRATYIENSKGRFLNIEGDQLDLSAVKLEELYSHKGDKRDRSLNLFMSIKKLILQNGEVATDVNLKIGYKKGDAGNFSLNLLFEDKKGYARVFYDKSVLSITTNNAGKLLRALGIYSHMYNGNLEVKAGIKENNTIEGNVWIEKFELKNSPILITILRLASFTSGQFLGVLNLLNSGNKIYFSSLTSHFRYNNGILSIPSCNMRGSALQVKGSGRINIDGRYIKFSGVMIPTHIFNTFLTVAQKFFPGIEDRLVEGSKNRANLLIEGPLDGKLKVRINPLSILAPGFMGEVFEGKIFSKGSAEAELHSEDTAH